MTENKNNTRTFTIIGIIIFVITALIVAAVLFIRSRGSGPGQTIPPVSGSSDETGGTAAVQG